MCAERQQVTLIESNHQNQNSHTRNQPPKQGQQHIPPLSPRGPCHFGAWHSEYFDWSSHRLRPRSQKLRGMASRGKFPLHRGSLVVSVVCWVLCSLFWLQPVTLSLLEQGDLCRTCTHSASTRAKKKRTKVAGRFSLANSKRPRFDWPSQANIHDQMHFAFRSEFRPLTNFAESIFTRLTSVQRKHYLFDELLALVPFGFWVVVWGCFWGFGCGLVCVLFPSLCSVSYPSTMSWAHRPHGVRTRGKKRTSICLERAWVECGTSCCLWFRDGL